MSAAQHIEWLNLVEKTGPFLAVGVLDEAFPQGLQKVETRKRQRVRSAYDEWRDAVDEEDPQLAGLHREWIRLVLEELLEYEPSLLKSNAELPVALRYIEPLSGVEAVPDFAALSGGKARLLVFHYAPNIDLSAPLAGEKWAASPIERTIAVCRATGVRAGIITDGEQWTLVSVPADGSSSFGTWYARIWQQEPVTLQAFVSLLGIRRCFGPAEVNLDALFLRSLEHQDEVTVTLGEQVRRAVEVLVQALDKADLDRDRKLLKDVLPTQLYEAGLTVMMRLVVLLCAEERKLLLLGEPIYDQHYAVSTLRARLVKDKECLGEEVLERRHDAWSRLLAVFRAVFGGIEHETLRLPPLGGSLFDPDRFPFLEGRAKGTSWHEVPAVPLPIDNRTVLMLLSALQVLEQRGGALLLSYESLDVEQIGHVYEGLLERTVKRVPETTLGLVGSQKAINPNVALRELEEMKAKGNDELLALLREKTGRSESGLRNALTKPMHEDLYHRILLASGGDTHLAARIKPFALLLRTDSWGDPLAYRENAFVVTLGAGRRETGTHYTPRSLTEPIVQHTLEPLVYEGPAEGMRREEWRLKNPAELLALTVCDMAMGSGAFLVQTCRWLAERLVEAWDAEERAGRFVSIEGFVFHQTGHTELLPCDQAERVLIARRLVASRCLYGVDINPMSVELAKLSLWLITMMRNRPFSFLDHSLKCGDSLLGISQLKQLERFSLSAVDHAQPLLETANLWRHIEQAGALRRELEAMPSHTAAQINEKTRLHAQAEAQLSKLRAAADFLIAAELHSATTRSRDSYRAVAANQMQAAWVKDKVEFQCLASVQLNGRRPFHWPLEFPEIFNNAGSANLALGFSAFIGNPPFIGGKKISGVLGDDYRRYLVVHLANGQRGSADLCAYFFLRAFSLITPCGGMQGQVATNTIAQGDTREVGLDRIAGPEQGTIVRAVSSTPWPGAAALEVAHVWVRRGIWAGERVLNEKPVSVITPFLSAAATIVGKPLRLAANRGKSFQGSIVLGMGFVLEPDEASELIAKDKRNKDVLFPYLNGEDMNSRPDQSPSRWVINFHDWPLDRRAKGSWEKATVEQRKAWLAQWTVPEDYPDQVASDFPDCLSIIEQRVKPERTRKEANGDFTLRFPLYAKWWIYADKRPTLYGELAALNFALAIPETTKYCTFSRVKTGLVFSHMTKIVAVENWTYVALLCSSLHEVWARAYSSTLETRLKYSVTDAFETFPFPALITSLSDIGEKYHEGRRKIMQARQEGLTRIYNRFNNPEESEDEIAEFRMLHRRLDTAVAASYDWADLAEDEGTALRHGFYETKQGIRWTLHPEVRRDVHDRLLALNHEYHAEEVAAGLCKKKGEEEKLANSRLQEPELVLETGGILKKTGEEIRNVD